MAYKKFTASNEQLEPDPKYSSKLVSKFVNCVMLDGKKSVAQKSVYQAMDIIAEKIKDAPPLEVFETAIQNVKPMIEVRSKRVGGTNYQVPMQVNSKRQLSLAIRWISRSDSVILPVVRSGLRTRTRVGFPLEGFIGRDSIEISFHNLSLKQTFDQSPTRSINGVCLRILYTIYPGLIEHPRM